MVAVLGCATLIALIWAVALERVSYERTDAIADAVRQNNNLAAALEEHTLRVIRAADAALLYVRREFADSGRIAEPAELSRIGLLDSGLVRTFLVTDTQGRVRDERGRPGALSVAERDFFAIHRDDAAAGLVISQPFVGLVTGQRILSLSRRISAADGSFGGIVGVAVDPAYFLSAYKTLDLGPRGLIQIVGVDGIVRARRIGAEVSFGQDMRRSSIIRLAADAPAGNFVSRGNTSDRATRYQSYRALPGYALVVSAGTAVDDALASFAARQRYYYATAAGGSLLLVLLTAGLLAWLRHQQRASHAIRQSEERFQQMAQHIGDVFFLQNLDGSEMYYVSPAYEKIWGRSVATVPAKPAPWAEAIHPEDAAYASVKFREGHGSGFDYEFRIVRPDGETRWIHVRGFPIRDAAGKAYRMAGVATDITRHKNAEQQLMQAEARYRGTFDQAAVGIAHASLDGTMLKVNRKLCETMGYGEAELLGRNFLDVTHPEDRPMSAEALRRYLESPDAVADRLEKRSVRKDGRVIWVALTAALVRDAAGSPDYLVVMMQDITARREAEERLLEQLDELRRFQAVTVERELRMIELETEVRLLRYGEAA
jgi:PAS domain S-box-containing protein